MNDASCKITLEKYPENCHAIVTVGNAFVLSGTTSNVLCLAKRDHLRPAVLFSRLLTLKALIRDITYPAS